MKRAVVVGAGLTGAAAARKLAEAGVYVNVYEEQPHTGGNVRVEEMFNIPYEPNGPHIFHTNDQEVYRYVSYWTFIHPYTHVVESRVSVDYQLAWPPQVDELKSLKEWPQIERELADRSSSPDKTNFETYAIDVMGVTLYRWFCYGYTKKQWGVEPRKLDASFAPKRIDLRDDGYRPLFRDKWQGWIDGGHLVNKLLWHENISVTTGYPLNCATTPRADGYVVTAPLNEFLVSDVKLQWRGQDFEHEAMYTDGQYTLDTPVVNMPMPEWSDIRKYETPQMTSWTSSKPMRTVLSTEYPGSLTNKHYPVNDLEGLNRYRQCSLEGKLARWRPNAVAAGRLGKYVYIDMDQAVRQGWNAARRVLKGAE